MSEATRRIGKIKVSRDILIRNDGACHAVFSEFTPLGIEWDWNGVATMTGLCEQFEELPTAVEPLNYDVQITLDDNEYYITMTKL